MDALKSAGRAIIRSPSIAKQTWAGGRHKKLPENCTDTGDTLLEGMLFNLKYLGMTLVEQPKGEELAAVKRIVATAKASGKKLVCSSHHLCTQSDCTSRKRTVAGYKQCDVENIAKIVSDNLDMDNGTKEMLKEALVSGDPEQATSIEIDLVIILRVVCTSLDKIASTDGLNLAVMINGILPDSTISLGPHLAAVTHTLGSLLGVVFGVVYQAGQIVYMVTDTAGEILSEIVCPPEVISHLTGVGMFDSVFGDLLSDKIGSLRTGLNGGSLTGTLSDLLYR